MGKVYIDPLLHYAPGGKCVCCLVQTGNFGILQ